MEYLSKMQNYIFTTPDKIKNYFYIEKKSKQQIIIESIDFNNTNTSDIIILLNDIKSQYKFASINHDNLYYHDKLTKLKYQLILCLENPMDTTERMIKYIRVYKGETYIPLSKDKIIDKEVEKLEKRYIELITVDPFDLIYKRYIELIKEDSKDSDDENNNNTESCIVKIVNKKKDAISC